MADRKKFTKTLRVVKPKLEKIEHPILNEKRVTPKKLPKYVEKILAAFAPNVVPEAMHALRLAISEGDIRSIENALKVYGMLSNGSGITINQQNVNAAGGDQAPPHRSIDAFYRDRAVNRGKVIDVLPEPECPPSSPRKLSPSAAGSATQA